MLTHLKHDNIVRLYCSYIQGKRHSLIFDHADGGTLDDFLCGKNRQGPKELQVLLALAELASAIDALHNFTTTTLNLSLAGCHHDLAPRNILVQEETFLLADFGLSTFRHPKEDSLTLFQEVRGSYLAPECQILVEGKFKPNKISQPSDIWSFGCILSECLTYLLRGPEAITRFRDERIGNVTQDVRWSRFHFGPGKPNPAVKHWLDSLEADEADEAPYSYCALMIKLIWQMLSMNPDERPPAKTVCTILRGVWIVSFGHGIEAQLDKISKANLDIDSALSRMRFESWLFAFHQLLDKAYEGEPESERFDFSKIVKALKETYRISRCSTQETTESAKHRQQSLLRYQHTKLTEALPLSYQRDAKDKLDRLLLSTDDVKELGDLSTATKVDDANIGALLAVKRLTVLANEGRLIERSDLVFDQSKITNEENFGIHSRASLEGEPVLVERVYYEGSWVDEVTGPELRLRLAAVIELLHAEATERIPGTLYCKGMFHEPSNRAVGVVYILPPLREEPVTLQDYLNRSHLPSLDDRFKLALDICRCIYNFHKAGWLHRNLHSKNILFFPANKAEWTNEPWIVGFSRSRESKPHSFTHGPQDNDLRSYQHPEYLTHQERYREEFDYYSIGLILLEIGLWKTLKELTNRERFQNLNEDEFKTEIIEGRVPNLKRTLGTRYEQAIRACLDGSLAEKLTDSKNNDDACGRFKSVVMDQISLKV